MTQDQAFVFVRQNLRWCPISVDATTPFQMSQKTFEAFACLIVHKLHGHALRSLTHAERQLNCCVIDANQYDCSSGLCSSESTKHGKVTLSQVKRRAVCAYSSPSYWRKWQYCNLLALHRGNTSCSKLYNTITHIGICCATASFGTHNPINYYRHLPSAALWNLCLCFTHGYEQNARGREIWTDSRHSVFVFPTIKCY